MGKYAIDRKALEEFAAKATDGELEEMAREMATAAQVVTAKVAARKSGNPGKLEPAAVNARPGSQQLVTGGDRDDDGRDSRGRRIDPTDPAVKADSNTRDWYGRAR